MNDKEYQHTLDIMERGIRADERKKVLDKLVVKLESDMPNRFNEKERYAYALALNIVIEQLSEV